MKVVRWASYILIAAIVLEAAWCLAMLFGIIAQPTGAEDVVHDTYYVVAGIRQFLRLAMFTLLGAVAAHWASWPTTANMKLRWAAAILALAGGLISLFAANWLTLKPTFFDEMPRRFPSEEEWAATEALGRLVYQAFGFGTLLIASAFLLLIVNWVRRFRATSA